VLPADIEIRPERPSDHEAIRDVVAAAFGSPAEARLVELIRASPEYVPEMALVAVSGAEAAGARDGASVVGHVMISAAVLRSGPGSAGADDRRIVMLSPLAVRPDRHGQGIGGALVRAAVSIADERGEPFVVLEGAPAYYGRFGFVPASSHGIRLPLPDWAPTEAAQILVLRADDPTLRGEVVYPAAFDTVTE
jgi:putative acetyltransferase